MPEAEESPELEEALTKALAANQLDESFRSTVRRFVDQRDDGWRVCCGSNCDPCVLPIGRAVDMVRKLIGWRE